MAKTNPPSFLARIFLTPSERRLRAGWRLLVHGVIFGVLMLVLGGGLGLLLYFSGNEALLTNQLVNQAIFLLALTLATYIARRFIDRRSFVSLGLAWNVQAVRDLVVGILIPAVIMGAIFLVEWAVGWLEFRGFAWEFGPSSTVAITVPLMFLVFVLVGWNEELLSRGYWLQNMAEGVNLPFGVALSSLIFGLLHLGNPNATWIAALGVALAGVFLAYGYLRTRQLWLSIGLHIGWNFFENTVFGFPVSGLDTLGLLFHTNTGPELITGGAFGPEAGLIVIPGMLLGAVLIYLYTRNRSGSDKKI
ncbi:MAG TPA: type II CAAX endopeptidase family protein [Anaerolineales bacterium]|nr:type II CAAX endopeptidase family protein [Anaerolineales bacterium]